MNDPADGYGPPSWSSAKGGKDCPFKRARRRRRFVLSSANIVVNRDHLVSTNQFEHIRPLFDDVAVTSVPGGHKPARRIRSVSGKVCVLRIRLHHAQHSGQCHLAAKTLAPLA